MNIKFPTTKPGYPSFVKIDNFLEPAFVKSISDELDSHAVKSIMEPHLMQDFRVNFSDNLPFVPDGKGNPVANRTYDNVSAENTFKKLINLCPNLSKLWSRICAEEFFNHCILENLDVLRHKGIVSTNFSFHPDTQLSTNKQKSIGKQTKLIVGPDFHLSISKDGYSVKVHSDNRYKILFGILFLNDIAKDDGGQTCFWSSHGSCNVADYPRYPEPNDIQLVSSIQPKSGCFVLGLNSNDAYHSVSKYVGRGRRKFIYFSYFVPDFENVWNVTFDT